MMHPLFKAVSSVVDPLVENFNYAVAVPIRRHGRAAPDPCPLNVVRILEDIKSIGGFRTDGDMARYIGISQGSVSRMRYVKSARMSTLTLLWDALERVNERRGPCLRQ